MQPKYTVLDWGTIGDQGTLYVSVDGFPGWVVETVVMPTTEAGLVISDLRVHPWQVFTAGTDEGTYRVGSRIIATNSPSPESGWSDLPVDVPTGGIPARLMRSINTGQLLMLARQQAAKAFSFNIGAAQRLAGAGNIALATEFLAMAHESRKVGITDRKRQGRRGNGIDHYLLWAVRYAEKAESVRYPIKALAAEFEETTTYVRDTIKDARYRYGLLTSGGQGRAGGTLTPKALELLKERENTAKKEN